MAVSVSTFKAAYPEFAKAGDTLLTEQLAQVELEVSDSWADRRDTVVMLTLADTLANSPWGRDARMVPVDKSGRVTGSSPYGIRLDAMKRAHGIRGSRLGSSPVTLFY